MRLSVLGERWRGSAQGIDDALYVQVGVGIGGGILIGGDVYRGDGGAAGEIGYLPIFDNDGDGRDGLGPFEHAAGGDSLRPPRPSRRCRRREPDGFSSSPAATSTRSMPRWSSPRPSAVTPRHSGFWTRCSGGWLKASPAAVTVLNPSTVIVGGGVSRAGERLLEPLQRLITDLVPVPPRVVLSSLGDESVALGATRLALQAVEERLFDLAVSEAV